MFLAAHLKQISKYLVFLLMLLSLTSCGGGGGNSSDNEPDEQVPKAISGKAQKGAFLKDSDVIAYQLDDKMVRSTGIVNAKTTDEIGSYSITPTWNDWTEVSITGRFFDEDSAANSATELTLSNIVPAGKEASNTNLFTHFVAERMRQIISVDENITIDTAYNQARSDLKTELALLSQNVDEMDASDGTGSLKNDNALLLLFSGGFMANNGNAASLLALTDDFANNGKIDDSSLTFFQGIANYVGIKSNLEKLSNNLKQAGFDSPPLVDDLATLPLWANQPPLVTITPKGKTIFEGQLILMDATASIDPEGSPLTYSWSGPGTGSCGEKVSCEISGLTIGTHSITLTARDVGQSVSSESATVIVVEAQDTNIFPVAAMLPTNISVKKGLPAVFDASNSMDGDGDSLSFSWAGPATENCGTSSTCSINGLSEGVYFISVTVSDNNGGVDSVISRLTVEAPNVPPIANAGNDVNTTIDRSIELTGSATDSDGIVTGFEWQQEGISLGTSSNITINGLGVGVYEYTLIATDDNGATASDTVVVTVTDTSNSAPVANAGDDKFITQGQSVFLFGSGTDLDGTIESYQWYEGSTLLGETENIVVPGLSVGTHDLILVVTDDKGGNDSDIVKVTVNSLNITVDVTSTGCIVRLNGRHFSVDLSLQGGETGSGTSIIQEYEGAGCTGDKIGNEVALATTYFLTNIQTLPTDNSITTADMTVSNIAGVETTQVLIVDGNVVLPESS